MDIDNIQFTGAIESPVDKRDYIYGEHLGFASSPYDWSKEYDIETVIGKIQPKDQSNSSSCGGQAWSYYSYVLDTTNREEKSAKFIYAHTKVGDGGSFGRSNCELCKSKGVSTEKLCPSYPATEQNLSDRQSITDEAFDNALTNKSLKYAQVSLNIDSIAQAVRDNYGCVIGIAGQNNGTWRTPFPKPPVSNDVWRHWVYVGRVKTIDGKKHIGFINSWGSVGENGWQWISEDYFINNYVWEAWTMVEDNGKYIFNNVLKIGSTGESVKKLQQKLNEILGLSLITDGKFGTKTKLAVIELQKKHNLTSDGIVGRITNKLLNTL